jgi:inner membrane protease ATP23
MGYAQMDDLIKKPPASPPQSHLSEGAGYTSGDDAWTYWRNVFSILTGNMSEAGKEQFRISQDIKNEIADCKRCEDQRDYLLKYS